MQSNNSVILQSPSFDTYSSSNRIGKIAARVVHEFQPPSHYQNYFSNQPILEEELNRNDNQIDREGEFEFAFTSNEPYLSPTPADQIRPVYPLFNTKLLCAKDNGDDDYVEVDRNSNTSTPATTNSPVRLPLRKLFVEERERGSPSCSSSEADEKDRVPTEMYCVWTPKITAHSPESCKKSHSTGSSRRWNKFRDILYRSNSEEKDTSVFLPSSNIYKKKRLSLNYTGSQSPAMFRRWSVV